MTITQQQIIALAVEAGFDDITPWLDAESVEQGQIDAASRWIERMTVFAALAYRRGVRDEREACEKVCEEIAGKHDDSAECESDSDFAMRFRVYAKHTRRCADAIRARSAE